MVLIIASFVFGSLIPYMARRFAKFMPATPGYAIYRLIKPNKHCVHRNDKYLKLKNKYIARSLLCAFITAGLSAIAVQKFGVLSRAWWVGFIWILILLAEIDLRMFLLPDILTVPLLICGFVFSSTTFNSEIEPFESSLAALVGYVVPVIASIFMLWKSKDAFGGGDIKLLAAIGSWLGIEGLLYTILFSCALFGLCMLIKQQRTGAFGPALVAAAIGYLLIVF